MGRPGTAGAGSGSSRTRLIHPAPFSAPRISAWSSESGQPRLRPLDLVVRETEFCRLRLVGDFARRTRENGRNSVRRPRHASLTDRNCEGFRLPGNRVGLPGLNGGRCRDRTDDHRDLASLRNEAAYRGFSARDDFTHGISNVLVGTWQALTINRQLAGKRQISLAFIPLRSNGLDVFRGAQAP